MTFLCIVFITWEFNEGFGKLEVVMLVIVLSFKRWFFDGI